MSSFSDCSSPWPKKLWFKAALPYLIVKSYIARYNEEEDGEEFDEYECDDDDDGV